MNYFFDNLAQLRQHVKVTESFQLEDLTSDLEAAGSTYLRDILGIGPELYDELLLAYQGGFDNLTDKQKKIMLHLRKPLANFAMMEYSNGAPVTFGNNGMSTYQNPQESPVRKWMVDKSVALFMKRGFEGLETILDYLEKNKNDFATWRDSDTYKIYRECFITSLSEFTNIYRPVSSRRTFIAVRHIMLRIQNEQLVQILGQSLYDQLKAQILNSASLTNANKDLLRYVKPYLVFKTMSKSFDELQIIINERGVQVLSMMSSEENNEQSENANSQIPRLKEGTLVTAGEAQVALLKFLHANTGVYPLFTTSPSYVVPGEEKDYGSKTDDKSFW